MKYKRLLTAILALFLIVFNHGLRSDISGAKSLVANKIDVLYTKFAAHPSSDEMSAEWVEQILNQELLPAIDVSKIVKLVLARHYKKATPEQRAEFSRVLTEYLIRTLSVAILDNRHIIKSYKDSIEIQDAVKGKNDNRATVSIVVASPSQSSRSILFRLGRSDANDVWKAYDVVIEGVSFAINYRAILDAEIKKSSIEEVTLDLAKRLDG